MNVLRAALERISREKVIKRRILVNGKSLPILVSPDAQLKYLKFGSNAFDHNLISIAESWLESSSNVWDIGANVGVFTFASSCVAFKGTVLAIEADIWLAGLLRKTLHFDEYKNKKICIVPVAVDSEDSISRFMVAKRGRASNALEVAKGRSQMGGVREMVYVPTLMLDTLLRSFHTPDFIKIDVEGAEYRVLRGAKNIIENVRPLFYVEVGRDVSSLVFNLFQKCSYLAVSPEGNVLKEECSSNTFFIPSEKSEMLLKFN